MPVTSRDIRTARTPRADLYGQRAFGEQIERLLVRSWHLAAVLADTPAPGAVAPLTLLPGVLDEPVLLVHGEDSRLRGFANVCTHRGALLVDHACTPRALRCPYHGRRFGLDGRMRQAPEFEGTPDFPSAADHLQRVQVGLWGPLVFVSVAPAVPFRTFIAPLERLAPWVPPALGQPERATYPVAAHWALWCENYLEGFHVPWVHPGLARQLDWRAYQTVPVEHGVVQLGVAPPGAPTLPLPAGHPHEALALGGLYVHLFPTTTLNFYPWGLSVNVVTPRAFDRTEILYQAWVRDPSLRAVGAGGALDEVELEDDAIVARVQQGVRSRLYPGGRYAANWEQGVFHFHGWIEGMLAP